MTTDEAEKELAEVIHEWLVGKLTTMQAELFVRIQGYDHTDIPKPRADGTNFSDTALIQTVNTDATISNGLHGKLHAVETALARILENPDKTCVCEQCEGYIPPGRIQLFPETLYCVTCQSRLAEK